MKKACFKPALLAIIYSLLFPSSPTCPFISTPDEFPIPVLEMFMQNPAIQAIFGIAVPYSCYTHFHAGVAVIIAADLKHA